MSDDEEYYEFEEDFMYEDLVPDMVDDLAASSYYEANLYEDPAFDVEDYFSDWDYYSDDYYDDDETAEQSAERKKRTEIAASAKRRTKGPSRKTTTVPTKSPLHPDVTTFQGVLWKTPALDRDQDVAILYEPHTGEKVALLENWREVFKSSQPALDKSKLKRRRVESRPETDNETADDESSSGGMSDDSFDAAGDTGDASNTTPDPEPDFRGMKLGSPPKVVIPVVPVAPVTPVTAAKRGRKRKAVAQEEAPGEDLKPRAKRVESRKGGEKAEESGDSSAPVRRSARQKK